MVDYGCQTTRKVDNNERKLDHSIMKESYETISFPLVVNPKLFLSRSHIWISLNFKEKIWLEKKVDHEHISIWYGYHD